MKYVLDTNVLAALMRGEERVVQRLERVTRPQVLVPEPAWAEIAYGLARLPRTTKRARLTARYEALRQELGTVSWTQETSEAFGELKAATSARGQRVEDFDVAIAAHALVIDAVLVTANTRHFQRFGELTVEDWS